MREGWRILRAVDVVAARLDSTPARVALAWLLARPSVTAPIASATGVRQLEEISKAPNIKPSKEDIALLDKASAS